MRDNTESFKKKVVTQRTGPLFYYSRKNLTNVVSYDDSSSNSIVNDYYSIKILIHLSKTKQNDMTKKPSLSISVNMFIFLETL